MNSDVNKTLMQLVKRAEQNSPEMLVETFVDVGPLFTMLSSQNHQVLYGRRGTGKTHALTYLAQMRVQKGEVALVVDFRTMGSSMGLYGDSTVSFAERSTRVFADLIHTIHGQVREAALNENSVLNIGELGGILDDLADAVAGVVIDGEVRRTERTEESADEKARVSASLGIDLKGPSAGLSVGSGGAKSLSQGMEIVRSGRERTRIHFGDLSRALDRLVANLPNKSLWLILDEWSSLPLDVQPYVADLLKRCVLPTRGLVVKIAAIEQRTRFEDDSGSIGLELGADIAADVSLDDFMLFDNNSSRSREFFADLMYRHYRATCEEREISVHAASAEELIKIAFTQQPVFDEFVRAAEGVPRDGIYILSISAQKAHNVSINMEHIRSAARDWFQRDKLSSVNKEPGALLFWIVDKVIGHRRARAFLLRSGTRDSLVDALFDDRVLHILKKNVSGQDQPGVRYDVYKIDYGCYVNLLTTAKAPKGLLPSENDEYTDVPPDDYRSIRRAILDLNEYYQSGDVVK